MKELFASFLIKCVACCYQFTAISNTRVILCTVREKNYQSSDIEKGEEEKNEGGKMWRQDIFLFNISLFVIFACFHYFVLRVEIFLYGPENLGGVRIFSSKTLAN